MMRIKDKNYNIYNSNRVSTKNKQFNQIFRKSKKKLVYRGKNSVSEKNRFLLKNIKTKFRERH
jgi:ribosomal protein L15E